MHEMSLAEGVLQLIEDAAKRDSFTRVKTVWLEIGQLAAVEPDALRFCFDAVTHGSLAAGAQLKILDIPGTGQCLKCGASIAMSESLCACPHCDSHQVQVTGGTQMRVKELEVE
jgi:hydrogenase nickel incorporation protein HypA/HybF